MRNLLFTLRYNGGVYHGWQVQQNAVTVQEVFQNAVEAVLGKREGITGCSRTDAGVHANMYCCNMHTQHAISEERLMAALNAHLPEDVAVYGCREVPADFHARYSCVSKEYKYLIWNSPCRNPFYEGRALHYKRPLSADFLHEQAQAFVGTYDYAGFASSGGSVTDTVRTVKRFKAEENGGLVTLTVEADGFLYNMVRIMVGTLLEISEGEAPAGTLRDIILSKDRSRAGKTAPAHGLYLNKVHY